MKYEAAHAFLLDSVPTPWREGDWAQIGIATKKDIRLIGVAGILHVGPSQVQLGLSLTHRVQGHGLPVSAVEACIGKLMVPLGIKRLRGITDERNSSSSKLFARLNFGEQVRVIVKGEACIGI